MRHKINK